MARGRDQYDAHQAALNALGRPLSRRARSACELCGASGSLSVVELEGGPEEPDEDWALLLCERCRELPGAKRLDAADLRFLETTVWSEIRPTQILAVRLVRRMAEDEVMWARECVESLYLDPEIEGLI
ncbi:MAG: phnA protein [Alphaproteobacteria bacterium]|nr:phnA protein [Alphaproteobacteria bacterium]MCB9794313.1 phnA protein [Alphaproteobacteria bacterium]